MKPTVWEAFNDPVIEVPLEQGQQVMAVAVMIMFAAWITPYWAAAADGPIAYYAPESVFEQVASLDFSSGAVLGISTDDPALAASPAVPEWYYAVASVPEAVSQSLVLGANEVLDISDPVQQMVDFYEPGVNAVWGAWLELMADPPVSPSF